MEGFWSGLGGFLKSELIPRGQCQWGFGESSMISHGWGLSLILSKSLELGGLRFHGSNRKKPNDF